MNDVVLVGFGLGRVLILLALFAFFGEAKAQNHPCSTVVHALSPYKGMMMTIGGVVAQTVTGQEAMLYGEGTKYSFFYYDGHGKKLGATWTVLPKGGRKIQDGDAFAWIPAPANVVATYPLADQERYSPVVFSKTGCRRTGTDFSSTPKEIPL